MSSPHTDQVNSLWTLANQQLIARSLSEFVYEQELVATKLSVTDLDETELGGTELEVNRAGADSYQVMLKDVAYQFTASHTLWDLLIIKPSSLSRKQEVATDALQFCLDLKKALSVDDIVFGNWLEDVQNTLHNEFQRLEKLAKYDASQLLQLDEPQLQGLLDAHPKIIANRGRLGWGAVDNESFAPESLQAFQLEYLAAHKSILTSGHLGDLNNRDLIASMMTDNSYHALTQALQESLFGTGFEVRDFALIPCHPWQYQHHIRPQFQWALQQKTLIHLGQAGDSYQPQQSIRTLSNVTRSKQFDVKLAITVLNTSCYRGVPEKFIAAGHHISHWLSQLTQSDSLFSERDLRILEEPAGYFVSHPYQNQVQGSPYRYHEMLGCIWRQSAVSKQQAGERHMLLSALLQKDLNDDSLIKELIQSSQLTTQEWLQQLFSVMSVPLYHLLVKYGVGVIAHGQNVVVYFKNAIPSAIAIKDFHGDLRLLDAELPEQAALAPEAKALLTKLPKEHLVHDLLTGHFISVYRFLSPLVAEQTEVAEETFYQLLAEQIDAYQQSQPQYSERFEWFDLFRPQVERICLNNVRFDIGYQDNAERPLPKLGSDLTNPIYLGLKALQETHHRDFETTIGVDANNNALQPITNSTKEYSL
ncbi:IucA/IucC family protein [Kangiella geojedonensis]|uniref:IucA/IucC family protein n=1 Tax=Kangiella geojedonensis TaxID=914150 RepID=A0A0F6RBM1_9GAMM|nr:IucA/IucC family protein [Kangiella geojedonensis]AKE51683.1 IucA/IucC family protein [Kangiella geojedonensis]